MWNKRLGLGKTTLFLELSKHYPMFSFPRDKWFDGYRNEIFWMIYWNEMTLAGKNFDIDDFKNFLEGIPTMLEVKGSKVEKEDNPQVFMTSNKNLQTMIKKRCGLFLGKDV